MMGQILLSIFGIVNLIKYRSNGEIEQQNFHSKKLEF